MPTTRCDAVMVHLRPLTRRDHRFCIRLYSSPSLMRLIGPPLPPAQALRNALAATSRRSTGPEAARDWIVTAGPGRRRAGLAGWRQRGGELELGIILDEPWQRRGLAVPAMRQLAHRALAQPQVEALLIRHRVGHAAMAAVARSLGFVRCEGADHGDAGEETQLLMWRLPSPMAACDGVS